MRIPDPKPETLVKIHLFAFVFWIVLSIPTLLIWKESILWIALMSIYAIVASHFTGWDAARAELAASKEENDDTD